MILIQYIELNLYNHVSHITRSEKKIKTTFRLSLVSWRSKLAN